MIAEEKLRADDGATLAALGGVLRGAGYDAERIEDELSLSTPLTRDELELPYYLRLLPETRLATLVKLFQLGAPVARADAEAALDPVPLERAEATGLLAWGGDAVTATVAIAPFGGVVVAYDWDDERSGPSRPDHVLGPSMPSRLLASITVRHEVDSALDVGSGAGLQSLLAARHARRIVATDVSERSLRFTRFNAALNGVENVETREGSLFDPVGSERFDLVVCNPPYAISPEADFAFRDSGLPGDSFCEALVRELPGKLADGGTGHAIVSWAHGRDEHWAAPLVGWLAGSGCDALLLRFSSQDGLSYASSWLRILGLDPAAYAEALDRWTDAYAELGIELLGSGAVVLRRRAGGGRVVAFDVRAERVGPAGHHVERLLENAAAGEPFRVAVAPDARLAEETAPATAERTRATLRLEGGLALEVDLDPTVARVVRSLDGRPPREALPAVRRLFELGFLVPANGAAA